MCYYLYCNYYSLIIIITLIDHPDSSWETGGKGVIQFKDGTSVARAIGTGRAVVYHKVEGMVDTHTEVSIEYRKEGRGRIKM